VNRRNILLGTSALIAVPAFNKLGGKLGVALAADILDPNRLNGELTPLGAERAGSASGLVPSWTGGANAPPAGWTPGMYSPDLFGHEKPIFSVTLANMAQYADMLSDGQVQMLKRFGNVGYRIDVYPCHRTACAPQWVYDNTFKNVTRAQAVPEGLVYGFTGAFCGPAFPILSNDPNVAGAEAMWNHLVSWRGEYCTSGQNIYIVGNNERTLASSEVEYIRAPYYNQNATPDTFGPYYLEYYLEYSGPPNQVGGKFLDNYALLHLKASDVAYEYLVGEGRIRQSPSYDYDIPSTPYGDAVDTDESTVFNGALDRYKWTLVGKKEMIVPYNQHKLYFASPNDVMGLQFMNPDLVRYEVHRCWVVEAHLAPGHRMSEPFRRFYLDEDTWRALLSDAYDDQGNYWKFGQNFNEVHPDLPGVTDLAGAWYNLQASEYVLQQTFYGPQGNRPTDFSPKPASLWEPQSMANSGGL
jgi:hypothetical protein